MRSTTIAALVLALVLSACTTRRTALVSLDGGIDAGPPVPPITSCEEALAVGFDGAPCAFPEPCETMRGPCCFQRVGCEGERLVLPPVECEAGCIDCASDRDCSLPTYCEGARCVECPMIDPGMCPPCPPPLELRVRNGCTTCECAPPSQCTVPEECGPMRVCAPGQLCAPGCGPAPECCSNVCADPGCELVPVPLGCFMDCPPELGCPDPLCVAAACRCELGRWVCDPVCAPPGYAFQC